MDEKAPFAGIIAPFLSLKRCLRHNFELLSFPLKEAGTD